MPQVIKKLAFRGDVVSNPFISWIILDAPMRDDMLIRGDAIWRIGFSSQLPLADCLPCVIYVNYIDTKNLVKRQLGEVY